MKKITIFVLVVGMLGALFVAFRNNPQKWEQIVPSSLVGDKTSTSSLPWIEVVTGEVEAFLVSTSTAVTLYTGDEILEGTEIRVGDSGLANLYFPDGSILRLEASSRISLTEAYYDPETNTLIAKTTLLFGKIWSKVLGLATSESVWEVKTANAVATVRGTSFGATYDENGDSEIVGSENTTEVSVIDPETGTIFEGSVLATTDTFVSVKSSEVSELKKGRRKLLLQNASPEFLAHEWVKRHKKSDTEFNEEAEKLRKRFPNNNQFRKEFRIQRQEKFLKSIEERRRIQINRLIQLQNTFATSTRAVSATSSFRTVDTLSELRPSALRVATQKDLTSVFQNDTVLFHAVLTLADGSKRDVTDRVLWRVVGPIGSITNLGVFHAELSSNVLQVGKGSSSVVAFGFDPKTGMKFEVHSPLFQVKVISR